MVYGSESMFYILALNVLSLDFFYSEQTSWYIYFSVIQKIFKVVDDLVADDTLIKDLHMSNLPTLSKKFIELLDILVYN